MKNRLFSMTIIGLMVVLRPATAVSADVSNVALGATVELEGAPFFSGGYGGGLIVAPSTLTDGVFLPRTTGGIKGRSGGIPETVKIGG